MVFKRHEFIPHKQNLTTTRDGRTARIAADVGPSLAAVLARELAFNGRATNHSTHVIHAFAAKFPPQLPNAFIESLSAPGDVVADPMAGSGTALVEAIHLGRGAIGFDIDPLAVKMSEAKTRRVSEEDALLYAEGVTDWARTATEDRSLFGLDRTYEEAYSARARAFFGYWFDEVTIRELAALVQGIAHVSPPGLRSLFEVIFSSIIVTKSGGVSLARDLAHSRPHKVASKRIAGAIDVFWEKARRTIPAVASLPNNGSQAYVALADSRALPLAPDVVDLIVTSPPYANAIDYVRAHKFSLIWLGHSPESLTLKRRHYIGAEVSQLDADIASPMARKVIGDVEALDHRKGAILRRYFADMKRSLREMLRILKPGKAAIVVVGSSTVRGVKVRTPFALAEEAESAGFSVVDVKLRPIDRDKRLMPISRSGNGTGIEARMHEEHVIGLLKPQSPP